MPVKYIKKSTTLLSNESAEVREKVSSIISRVSLEGDKALMEYSKQLDGLKGGSLKVSKAEIAAAYRAISPEIIEDLKLAAERIEKFALLQKESIVPVEKQISPGIILGHRIIPVSSCGAYVPGGRYPLPSSALMSIIPARVAGVKRIAACSPPSRATGFIHPATLIAMDIAGATEIYCMGGAQAVAAMAFGTESIKPVDIIVGPGNQWVTEAKRQVSGTVGIDFLAGPSEVLIIADGTANPEFIAADLLAQSEHDPQARGILITTDENIAQEVCDLVKKFLEKLKTCDVASKAWDKNGEILLVDSLEEAVSLANDFAPEHLELAVSAPEEIADKLINYGSLFIGKWSAEVFGDYVSGTNHILPTMRASRYTGGVWVGTFLKIASYQKITQEGAAMLAPTACRLAEMEGLFAHKLAAEVRNRGDI
ncbi:MAG: sulfopropanediol 3-dehydrogenase [Tepidanaerobacteraceae bacterium]|nr:sulfopropanediol 3-dehydrogenase [Tepidanaerobacteraceae bacterium]